MRATVIVSLTLVALAACTTNTAEQSAASQASEVSSTGLRRVRSDNDGLSCAMWGCNLVAEDVSNDEIFDFATRFLKLAHDAESPPTPELVRLSSMECTVISGTCSFSCSVRTICGGKLGGGTVDDAADADMVFSWLSAQKPAVVKTELAWRMRIENIACTRDSGATTCTLDAPK